MTISKEKNANYLPLTMHINDNQSSERDPGIHGQLASDQRHRLHNRHIALLQVHVERVGRDVSLAVHSPEDLAARDHYLTGPLHNPLVALLALVVLTGVLDHMPDRLGHHGLHLQQPLLHHAPRPVRVDLLAEGHHLVMSKSHVS